jgi:hypothetical protein
VRASVKGSNTELEGSLEAQACTYIPKHRHQRVSVVEWTPAQVLWVHLEARVCANPARRHASALFRSLTPPPVRLAGVGRCALRPRRDGGGGWAAVRERAGGPRRQPAQRAAGGQLTRRRAAHRATRRRAAQQRVPGGARAGGRRGAASVPHRHRPRRRGGFPASGGGPPDSLCVCMRALSSTSRSLYLVLGGACARPCG